MLNGELFANLQSNAAMRRRSSADQANKTLLAGELAELIQKRLKTFHPHIRQKQSEKFTRAPI